MPPIGKKIFFSSLITISFSIPYSYSQDCKQMSILWDMINTYHVQPKPLDDSLSKAIYNDMIESLDPYGMYFIQEDLDVLSKYEFTLDESIKNGNCDCITEIATIYEKRLNEADTTIAKILNSPFDYKMKEELTFSNEIPWTLAKDITSRDNRWRRWLKYQTLKRIFTPRGVDDKPTNVDNAAFQKLEKPSRDDVKIFEQKKVKNILNEYNSMYDYVLNEYSKAFAFYFDPHTEYYTNAEKNQFQSSVTSENLSFGIEIKENEKNEVEITKLTPGGPAWKTNQLNKGDLIVAADWGDGKHTDLSFAGGNEAYSILFEKDIKEVELTIKKANGSIKTVHVEKEKLVEDENVIQSFILEGEKRIGYIFLPSFYSDWEDKTKLGCANDLAKKLVVLQKENIDGLILDIRNNGGGSVHEAIDLVGIFIDAGPVTIDKDREEINVMKDANRGAIYNGPLIIMVNGLSASASEILSASLQDHNRALIVGSTTYGKSTGQVILPVTNNPLRIDAEGEYGYLKLTGSIFYRINSTTHQKKGVIPDVHIPDLYESLNYRETRYKYVLNADSIYKKTYYTPLLGPPKGDLQELSTLRLRNSNYFKNVVAISDSVKTIFNSEYKIPLDMEGFKKGHQKGDYRWSSWEEMMKHSTDVFKVLNDPYTRDLIKIDEYNREINEFQIKNIENDIYIDETFKIMLDYINLEK